MPEARRRKKGPNRSVELADISSQITSGARLPSANWPSTIKNHLSLENLFDSIRSGSYVPSRGWT